MFGESLRLQNPPRTPENKAVSATVQRKNLVSSCVLVCFVFAFAAVPAISPVLDYDVWWQIRTGQWIAEHVTVPTTDEFSIDGDGKIWIAYYWLFSLITAGCFESLGLAGIVVLKLTFALLIAAAMLRLVRHLEPNLTVVVVLTCLALVALQPRFGFARSWLCSILLFTIELDVLLMARRSGETRRLWWMPLLFVLWVNLHVQFVYGLCTVLFAGVDAVMEKMRRQPAPQRTEILRTAKSWTLLFLACLAATLVNPYGVGFYRVVEQYASQTGFYDIVAEFQSPSFRFLPDWIVLAIASAAVFALGWRRHVPVFQALLLTLGMYLGFRAARDTWYLIIAGTAIIADSGLLKWRIVPRQPGRLQTAACAVAVGTASLFVFRLTIGTNSYLSAAVAKQFPDGAAQFVEDNKLQGPLFNTYGWGGYLMWRLPHLKVDVDGRAHIHGLAAVQRNVDTREGRHGWQSHVELQRARLVLLPSNVPLSSLLRFDRRFQLVYEDEVAVVFVRKEAAGSAETECPSPVSTQPIGRTKREKGGQAYRIQFSRE